MIYMILQGCLKEQIRKYPNLSIIVDTNGAGTGLKQHLLREGIHFEEVNWGVPCFSNNDKAIYSNDRALASVCLQRAVKAGNFKVLTPLYRSKIEEQLTRLPYKFDEKGRYKIPSKEDMRRNGIASPDIVDTFAFLFLRQSYVIPAKQERMALENKDSLLKQKQAKLQDLATLIA